MNTEQAIVLCVLLFFFFFFCGIHKQMFFGPWLCFSPSFFVSHSAFSFEMFHYPYPLPALPDFCTFCLKAKSQDNNRHINKLDLSSAVLLHHLHHTALKCVCVFISLRPILQWFEKEEKDSLLPSYFLSFLLQPVQSCSLGSFLSTFFLHPI